MKVVQLSTSDLRGGAEKVSVTLHREFLRNGHDSHLVVGYKHTEAPGVTALSDFEHRVSGDRLKRAVATMIGIQYVGYPASYRIPEITGGWDLLIAHNLHGRYFETAALRDLARVGPMVLNLHDMWMFTGHCAHDLGCARWKVGCGSCCDKSLYPAITLDVTRSNLRRKERAVVGTDIAVCSPSRWMLGLARQSYLRGQRMHSIPNPVDTNVFCPGDVARARARLQLPAETPVVMLPAKAGLTSRWKNADLLLEALRQVDREVLVVAFGGTGRSNTRDVRVMELPDISSEETMSECYRAADLVILPSRAETSPLTVLEAMASGKPVIATDVGGTSELIQDRGTGFLIPPDDRSALARAITDCLADEALRTRITQAALRYVEKVHAAPVVAAEWISWAGRLADEAAPRSSL